MTEPFLFADVLQQYVTRSAYTAGQLARLSGIPKTTIMSWLSGLVKRPQSPENLSQLAQILHLTQSETETLLRAAGHLSYPQRRWPQNALESSAPFQTSPQLPYYIERPALIARLEAVIFAKIPRKVICLIGMGGVGKTALAARLAYGLRASFPDGVLWAETSRANSLSILGTMAHGYGLDVSPYKDVVSRAKVVRQLLVNKQFLLVLDDVQSSAEIVDLLPAAPKGTVVITTRRQDLALAIGGQRFEIPPFGADSQAAQALFEQLLQRKLSDNEAIQAQQIAQALGHLPLAIAIAASRLAYEPGWQISDFLARLNQKAERGQLLTYEGLSVEASFATGFERLPHDLQHFLTSLAIFDGRSFTDTAVAHMRQQSLNTVQDQLRALHNVSLIQAQTDQGGTRYTLHPLLSDCIRVRSCRHFAANQAR